MRALRSRRSWAEAIVQWVILALMLGCIAVGWEGMITLGLPSWVTWLAVAFQALSAVYVTTRWVCWGSPR